MVKWVILAKRYQWALLPLPAANQALQLCRGPNLPHPPQTDILSSSAQAVNPHTQSVFVASLCMNLARSRVKSSRRQNREKTKSERLLFFAQASRSPHNYWLFATLSFVVVKLGQFLAFSQPLLRFLEICEGDVVLDTQFGDERVDRIFLFDPLVLALQDPIE